MNRKSSGGQYEGLGFQALGTLNTAKPLTVPSGARLAILKPAAQAIRVRDDGTDPTAAVGYPVAVGQEFEYHGRLEKLRIIEQAASATVDILYYA